MTLAEKKRLRHPTRRARRIASAGVKGPLLTTADHSVAALRSGLAMPRSKFARLVGRTERAVIDWELGKASPQGLSQQRVRELERLTAALGKLFERRVLGKWFETPNPVFGGLKPTEVIERGETDRLWQMIFELKAGSHV